MSRFRAQGLKCSSVRGRGLRVLVRKVKQHVSRKPNTGISHHLRPEPRKVFMLLAPLASRRKVERKVCETEHRSVAPFHFRNPHNQALEQQHCEHTLVGPSSRAGSSFQPRPLPRNPSSEDLRIFTPNPLPLTVPRLVPRLVSWCPGMSRPASWLASWCPGLSRPMSRPVSWYPGWCPGQCLGMSRQIVLVPRRVSRLESRPVPRPISRPMPRLVSWCPGRMHEWRGEGR